MMRRLALFGAGGHGKVVADAALCAGWQDIAFFDDAWPKLRTCGAWPVLGGSAALAQRLKEFDGAVVTIGGNTIRLDKLRWLQGLDAPLVSVVHPGAIVSRYASIGLGSVIMPGAVVNVDARLGLGCIVNTGATVDHECQIGDGVHISPGATLSGQVSVGQATWIGAGAVVRHCVSVGQQATVGAGAVVLRPVADGLTVVGNPARVLPRGNSPHS